MGCDCRGCTCRTTTTTTTITYPDRIVERTTTTETETTSAPDCPVDASLTFSVLDDSSYIGGGCKNEVSGAESTILGGTRNTVIDADWASIIAGQQNQAVSKWSTVAGGFDGVAKGKFAAVAGGSCNNAKGRWSVALGKIADAASDHSACFDFDGSSDTCSIDEKTLEIKAGIVSINGMLMSNVVDSILFKHGRLLKEIQSSTMEVHQLAQRAQQQQTAISQLKTVALNNEGLRKRVNRLKKEIHQLQQ